jgi:cytochrome c biogenesis protein CcmG, thiol:disulfide interchange protein DsbE
VTNRQQWTLIAGMLTTVVFGVALAIKLRPQFDLIELGSKAPAFRATDLRTGRPVSLADYRGKVILLNIWATWCPPCRVEMPSMERLHKKFAGTEFRIVAVSVDADPFFPQEKVDASGIMAFANDMGLSFDILHDPSGGIRSAYQSVAVPESFVINRDGVIVKKVIGAAEWDGPVNEQLIQRLLDAR